MTLIGWREWVTLPHLGVDWVKAKTDTGARSSSLDASDIEYFDRDGDPWVRFNVHPWQANRMSVVSTEARLHDVRVIRSSSGQTSKRPVIRTMIRVGSHRHEIDLTLTSREDMGFRMLLGREAMRKVFKVDPGRSYLAGRPPKRIRALNRDTSEPGVELDTSADGVEL